MQLVALLCRDVCQQRTAHAAPGTAIDAAVDASARAAARAAQHAAVCAAVSLAVSAAARAAQRTAQHATVGTAVSLAAKCAAKCAAQHAATIAAAANHASGCTAQRGPTLLDRLRQRWHVHRLLRVGGCVLPSRIPVGECGMRLRHARVRVHSLLRATIWKRAAHAAASVAIHASITATSLANRSR